MNQTKLLKLLSTIFVVAGVIYFSAKALDPEEALQAAGMSTDEASTAEYDEEVYVSEDGEWEEFEVDEGELPPAGEEWIEVYDDESSMEEPETIDMEPETTTAPSITMAPTPPAPNGMATSPTMEAAPATSMEPAATEEGMMDIADMESMIGEEWEIIEVEEGETAPAGEEWIEVSDAEIDEYETMEDSEEEGLEETTMA